MVSFSISLFLILFKVIYDNFFCFSGAYKNSCPFLKFKDAFIDPFFIFLLGLIIILFILFFVSERIFLKWLKLGLSLTFISLLWIFSTPVIIHSFNPVAFERIGVAVLTSKFLVIVSIVMIIIWTIQEKRKSKKGN